MAIPKAQNQMLEEGSMIEKIKISNFKSIEELELDLGRINVLIGENGCGKTNILEAIGFGSLGIQKKLEHELLYSRGIRSNAENFGIYFHELNPAIFQYVENEFKSEIFCTIDLKNKNRFDAIPGYITEDGKKLITLETISISGPEGEDFLNSPPKEWQEHFSHNDKIKKGIESRFYEQGLFSYLNFTLNYFSLETFSDPEAILPLGIKGEGLFRELQKIIRDQPEKFNEIKVGLAAIGWFEDIDIPEDLFIYEKRIRIKDRYLGSNPDVQFLDQRSANEGFLFLLFYFTLFVSDDTPKFFAIDNIDQALNPRLCIKLMQTLTEMAKKHDKQVIFTTHNPSILDGLDLDDDQQRLHVVFRNADGKTVVKRHQRKKGLPGVEPVRLSEAFIRGYLGGLPKHF